MFPINPAPNHTEIAQVHPLVSTLYPAVSGIYPRFSYVLTTYTSLDDYYYYLERSRRD
jgi:hypothetical protein